MPFFVVATEASRITSPASSNTQIRLFLSPRSIPIVIRSVLRALSTRFELPGTLLFFLMPVSFFAPRVRFHWELNASRRETGLLIPSQNPISADTRSGNRRQDRRRYRFGHVNGLSPKSEAIHLGGS